MKQKILLIGLALSAFLFLSPPSFSQTPGLPDTTQIAPIVKVDPVQPPTLKHDSVVLSTIDSVVATIPIQQIIAPSTVTIFGIKMPLWLGIAIIALMLILPGVQLILKKIPSAAPIEGVIGAILNFFTIFQKNIVITPTPPNSTAAKTGP